VFDDVERRRFLVEPAREDAAPAAVRLLDVDLHERAGQLLVFPWRGRLAGAQPDDRVLPAHRLAGVERDVLDDPVALVEDSEHCDALRHRGDAAFAVRRRGGLPGGGQRGIRLVRTLVARRKRERSEQQCRGGLHAYSGIQGS
jgi:hypothetical protein